MTPDPPCVGSPALGPKTSLGGPAAESQAPRWSQKTGTGRGGEGKPEALQRSREDEVELGRDKDPEALQQPREA